MNRLQELNKFTKQKWISHLEQNWKDYGKVNNKLQCGQKTGKKKQGYCGILNPGQFKSHYTWTLNVTMNEVLCASVVSPEADNSASTVKLTIHSSL